MIRSCVWSHGGLAITRRGDQRSDPVALKVAEDAFAGALEQAQRHPAPADSGVTGYFAAARNE